MIICIIYHVGTGFVPDWVKESNPNERLPMAEYRSQTDALKTTKAVCEKRDLWKSGGIGVDGLYFKMVNFP
jgi:hypothetical protein